MVSLQLTIVHATTGQSESIPVTTGTKLEELAEWCSALFDEPASGVVLLHNQQALPSTGTLGEAGVADGDLLVVDKASRRVTPAAPAANAGGGMLDFSNLLGGAAAPPAAPAMGGLNFSNLLGSAAAAPTPSEPFYHAGMNLEEAQAYNSNPENFCKLLLQHEHLRKELNYYLPSLSSKMFPAGAGTPLAHATQIWRDHMIKGGIASALRMTNRFHEEKTMRERLAKNPDDAEATKYFADKEKKQKIAEQREQVYDAYPEAFTRVTMLYIATKINGHDVQAFCDSGAQTTVMSHKMAKLCGLEDYIDESMAGMAVGVGTSKIIGRIHSVQLQIGSSFLPCSVTVLEDAKNGAQEMGFLLGLDMMKRHLCVLDLGSRCLKFQTSPGQYQEAQFLNEKDLDQSKGGTKDFDQKKANEEYQKMMEDD